MRVRRRRFLEASAAGLVMASWPGFIREAFGAELDTTCPQDVPPTDSTSSCQELLAAHERARTTGRPLLVIVIPTGLDQRHARGALFGTLINWGDDEVLAALGLCEVVCATMADVQTVATQSRSIDGEPLALLIETAEEQGDVRAVSRDLLGTAAKLESLAWNDGTMERASSALARLLREAVAAHPARAGRLRSRAAVVQLATEARAQLKDQRVPGSRWATSTGCGTSVEVLPGEKDPSMMVDCGMGHVPKKARRMLYFFVDRREV